MVAWLAEHHGEYDRARLTAALPGTTPAEVLDQAWQLKANRTYSASAFVAAAITDLYNAKNRQHQIAPRMPRTYSQSLHMYLAEKQR